MSTYTISVVSNDFKAKDNSTVLEHFGNDIIENSDGTLAFWSTPDSNIDIDDVEELLKENLETPIIYLWAIKNNERVISASVTALHPSGEEMDMNLSSIHFYAQEKWGKLNSYLPD